MGGGGTKTHESFTVTPTLVADPPGLVKDFGGDGEGVGGPGLYVVESVDSAELEEDPAHGFDELVAGVAGAEDFEALKAQVAEASQALEEAAAGGLPAELVADGNKQLHQETTAWLSSLSKEELAGLAAANGFEHPSLVGISEKGAMHPLVHWLDPSYPSDIASKAKIQAKADERYATLAAGGTINGMTLADVQAAEAGNTAIPTAEGGGWVATPGEVVAAQAALSDSIVAFNSHNNPYLAVDEKTAALGSMIAAEDHLATATCAELGQHLEAAKGSARASVDAAVNNSAQLAPLHNGIRAMASEAVAAGKVPPGTDLVASRDEALKLLRQSTPAAERAVLADQIAERSAQWAKFQEHLGNAQTIGKVGELPGLDGGAGNAQLVEYANNAGALYQTRTEMVAAGWTGSALGHSELMAGHLHSLPPAGSVTSAFKDWSKSQPLGELRATAETLGLSHADAAAATRGQVQNHIASTWDPNISKGTSTGAGAAEAKALKAANANAAKVAAAPAAPVAAVGSQKPPTGAPTMAQSAAAAASPPSGRSFAAKHLALVEALKHHAASTGALPTRTAASEVAGWEFTPAQGPQLGGQHTKTFWHPPGEQSVWMFKEDKYAGGARAQGEAAASQIYHQVGLPSVPVYARTIRGKKGVVQPLLQGASNLSPSPSSWSQADVDALVRSHVGAWAVGDHDGKVENQLRTAGGGLVPCDHGCSFKFFGSDKLSTSYQPTSTTAVQQLYQAGKSGGLGKGVQVRPEAALPVIKAFEKMPDSAYRAMLHQTAHEGVKQRVTWYDTMKSKAAARHGTSTPSDAQVAEEFLTHAVERKHGLRQAFAGFFAKEGFAGSAKLTKVA